MEKHASKTLFVRNLPFSTTNGSLEEIFSDVGPLKKCFVVKDQDSTHPCRGYGYVTFSVREDAERALKEVNVVGDRKVYITFADKKQDGKKKKKSDNKQEAESPENSLVQPDAEKVSAKKTSDNDQKGPKTYVTVKGVSGKTKKTDFANLLGKGQPIKEYSTNDDGSIRLTFTSHKDAVKAYNKVNNRTLNGAKLFAGVGDRVKVFSNKIDDADKKSRLIIRNLSFKCSENDLREAFTECGQINEVRIPTQPNGRHRGFGFVQFTKLDEAAAAIQKLNAQSIKGRPVAVDWALPRDKFIAAKETSKKDDKSSVLKQGDGGSLEDDYSQSDDNNSSDHTNSNSSSDSESEPSQENIKKKKVPTATLR